MANSEVCYTDSSNAKGLYLAQAGHRQTWGKFSQKVSHETRLYHSRRKLHKKVRRN